MLGVSVSVEGGGLSARQEAMNSCRSGFIRWRIRDGPIGSHHELARDEKCETSSAETDDVLCQRGFGSLCGCVVRRGEFWWWHVDGLVALGAARRARRGKERGRKGAILNLRRK